MLNVFLGFIYSTFESLVNHRTFICLLPVSPLAYRSHKPLPHAGHDQHPHQSLSEGPTVNARSMDFAPSKTTPFRELKGTRIQMMIARILHEFTLIKNPDPGKHNWCRLLRCRKYSHPDFVKKITFSPRWLRTVVDFNFKWSFPSTVQGAQPDTRSSTRTGSKVGSTSFFSRPSTSSSSVLYSSMVSPLTKWMTLRGTLFFFPMTPSSTFSKPLSPLI